MAFNIDTMLHGIHSGFGDLPHIYPGTSTAHNVYKQLNVTVLGFLGREAVMEVDQSMEITNTKIFQMRFWLAFWCGAHSGHSFKMYDLGSGLCLHMLSCVYFLLMVLPTKVNYYEWRKQDDNCG